MKAEYSLKSQDQSMSGKMVRQYPIRGKTPSDKNSRSWYRGEKYSYTSLITAKQSARTSKSGSGRNRDEPATDDVAPETGSPMTVPVTSSSH